MTHTAMQEKTFYMVGRNKKCSKDAVPLSFFKSKPNCEVHESRLDGDYSLWIEGKNMATLFESRVDALAYLSKLIYQ